MPGAEMLIVTQVAPYADGPAGVHGVLGQAATALQELATMTGLDPTVATDVADISPDRLAGARVLALFTIGETPWSPAQKEAITTSWRQGQLRILGIHSATDANHLWPEYGTMLGARFDGHPWTQDFAIDVIDATHTAISPRPTSPRSRNGTGGTRSISSPTCAPTPTSCSAWPRTRSTSPPRADGSRTAASRWPGP